MQQLISPYEIVYLSTCQILLSIFFYLGGLVDTTDSLTSSTCSSTVARPLQNHQSLENIIPFPDTGDPTD